MRGWCFGRPWPGEEMGAVTEFDVLVAVTGRGPSCACALGVVVYFVGAFFASGFVALCVFGADVAFETSGTDDVDRFRAAGNGSRLSASWTDAGSGAPIVFGRPFGVFPESLTCDSTETGFMRSPSNVPCAVDGLPVLLFVELARSRIEDVPLAPAMICGSGVALLLLSLPAIKLPLLVISPFSVGMLFFPKVILFLVDSATRLTSFFSAFSISPNTVCPFCARFSSRMGTNVTIPRSEGTLKMSVMNDCTNAALRLFVDAPICAGTAEMLRM